MTYEISMLGAFSCDPPVVAIDVIIPGGGGGGGGGGHSHQLPYGGVPLYRVDFEWPVSLK